MYTRLSSPFANGCRWMSPAPIGFAGLLVPVDVVVGMAVGADRVAALGDAQAETARLKTRHQITNINKRLCIVLLLTFPDKGHDKLLIGRARDAKPTK